MRVRQTSIDAYNEIKSNGLLSKRRMEVYDILYREGPLSAFEVYEILKKHTPNIRDHSVTPRFSELKKMELIEEVGEKMGPLGTSVILWDVTSNLPKKIEKKEYGFAYIVMSFGAFDPEGFLSEAKAKEFKLKNGGNIYKVRMNK